MKKSVLALAVLGTFASIASAQSSVTIYGRLDQAYGRKQGAVNSTGVFDPSGSRIGFKGTEDLGGGLKALFNLEHRFYADDGTAPYGVPSVSGTAAGQFWGARAFVGLESGVNRVVIGREYTAAFLVLENPLDPWKGDTIATSKPLSLGGSPGITGSTNIEPARFDNSINYTFTDTTTGITAAASWGAKEAAVGKNSYSLAANYAAGPIFVGISHTNPNDTYSTSKWTLLGGTYDFGVVKPGVMFGTGTKAATAAATPGNKIRTWALTAVAPVGNGQVRALYGQRTNKNNATNSVSTKEVKQASLGYWYSLSKRTTVYTDVVRDKGTLMTHTFGYEMGLKHDF